MTELLTGKTVLIDARKKTFCICYIPPFLLFLSFLRFIFLLMLSVFACLNSVLFLLLTCTQHPPTHRRHIFLSGFSVLQVSVKTVINSLRSQHACWIFVTTCHVSLFQHTSFNFMIYYFMYLYVKRNVPVHKTRRISVCWYIRRVQGSCLGLCLIISLKVCTVQFLLGPSFSVLRAPGLGLIWG